MGWVVTFTVTGRSKNFKTENTSSITIFKTNALWLYSPFTGNILLCFGITDLYFKKLSSPYSLFLIALPLGRFFRGHIRRPLAKFILAYLAQQSLTHCILERIFKIKDPWNKVKYTQNAQSLQVHTKSDVGYSRAGNNRFIFYHIFTITRPHCIILFNAFMPSSFHGTQMGLYSISRQSPIVRLVWQAKLAYYHKVTI